jgi:hypothetical protein
MEYSDQGSSGFPPSLQANIRSVSWGHAVAYMVEALCYKPEGLGFDSRRGHWIFQFT